MKTRTTNRLLTLLLSLCMLLGILPLSGTLSVAAQEGNIPITEEYFPDPNFRSWLKNPNNIGGKGEDGVLTPEEIESIDRMDVVGTGPGNDPTGITDVTGIKLFTNLKYLNCYYHPGMTSLDLSGLKFLEDVNCSVNSLTELNVSGCESLVTMHVNDNQLSNLDLSKTPKIRNLTGGNQICTLTLLGSEDTGYTLPIALNNPVFFGGNEKHVSYKNGTLTSLDKSADTVFFRVETGANNLSLLGSFTLTYPDDVPVNEVTFPDENFRNWLLDETNLSGTGMDALLTPEELAAITTMNISGLGISDLTGIQHFANLNTLDCSNNNLLALDVSKLMKLTSFRGDNQTVSRELTDKGSGDYILPITLNNPKFTGTNAVSYENGNLISRDSSVSAVEFTTDIGLTDKKLSGSLTLSYLDDYDGVSIHPGTFPDPAFRDWLKNDANLGGTGADGLLTTEEIASIKSISIKDSEITDLTGIRCFSALEELSFTGMDALKFLDVSGLTKLKTLTCSNTGVKTLDIGGCASLNRLTCDDNPNLTELTLYALTATEEHGLTRLEYLSCARNSLTKLDIFRCWSLKELDCSGNRLSSLELWSDTKKHSLDKQTVPLTLAGNKKDGYSLPITLNNPTFEGENEKDFSYENGILKSTNPNADTVEFSIVTNNRKPNFPRLTGTFKLSYQEYQANEAEILIDENHFPDSSFRAWILNPDNLNGAGKDGILTPPEIAAVKSIDVSGLGIIDLTGIRQFTALQTLNCSDNRLTSLDLTGLTDLTTCESGGQNVDLTLGANEPGSYVDRLVLNNPVFTGEKHQAFSYQYNMLKSTDNTAAAVDFTADTGLAGKTLSGTMHMSYLEYIPIDEHRFPNPRFRYWLRNSANLNGAGLDGMLTPEEIASVTSIDFATSTIMDITGIQYFTALESLTCRTNDIKTLDVSGLSRLQFLYCDHNPLTELVVSGCTELKTLWCFDSKLTELVVSDCIELETLWCYDSKLTSLDLSNNPKLANPWLGKQETTLTLTGSEKNGYSLPITLNNPEFTGPDAISYENGVLKSTDKTVDTVELSVETKPGSRLTITLNLLYSDTPAYTLTVKNGTGSGTYEPGTQVSIMADPPEGYTFNKWQWTSGLGVLTDPTAVRTTFTMGESNATVTALYNDPGTPTGEVKVGTNGWTKFLDKITFGLFFKETQKVSITAGDSSGKDVTIEYFLSSDILTLETLQAKNTGWSKYTKEFSVDPERKFIVYVRLTNAAGNVAYLCSDGLVLDNTAPVITGAENGQTYDSILNITVTDDYLKSVTVGTESKTVENGKCAFTLTENGSYTITAEDQAGNKSIWIFTIDRELSNDATLSGATYSVNGGIPIPVPNFRPGNFNYYLTLPRDTPRNAVITVKGQPSNSLASSDTPSAVLIHGITPLNAPISLTVTADNGDQKTYSFNFNTESMTPDFDGTINGIENDKDYSKNLPLNFTATGAGMNNESPVVGDERYVPKSWKLSDDALQGSWEDAPYTHDLDLNNLTLGMYTLTVEYKWQSFNILYDDKTDEPSGEYGWEDVFESTPIERTKSVAFNVAKAVTAYTLTFDTDGGKPIPDVQTLNAGQTPDTVSAPMKEGYIFMGWQNLDGEMINLAEFKMPEANVTLKAKWEKNETPPTAYTLTVENGTGSGTYAAGQEVSISAIVPEGKAFVQWELKSGNGTLQDAQSQQTSFTMGESDAMIAAVLRDSGTTNPTDPSDPVNPNDPASPSGSADPTGDANPSAVPLTGDDFPAWAFWLVLLSLLSMGALLLSLKKQKVKE